MGRLVIAAILCFLLVFFLPAHFVEIGIRAPASYPVHNLNTNLNYTTIQDAIDAPETLNGHTIFVEQGIYFENLVVNKSLSLIGENRDTTIIDGNYSGNVITITTNNVTITKCTIQKSWMGIWPFFNGSGIYVDKASSNNNISYTLIIDNLLYGILLNTSNNNVIAENTFLNNTSFGIAMFFSNGNIISNNTFLGPSSGGIALSNSSDNIVYDNIVSNNNSGIALSKSGHNYLSNNNMTGNIVNFAVIGNSRYDFNNSVSVTNMVDGKCVYYLQDFEDIILDSQHSIGTLYLINCNNVTVQDLCLSKNGFGLLLYGTRNSKIENTTVSNNYYGLHLLSSTNITICESYIANNLDDGIWLYSSLSCIISGNNIEANQDRGIQLELSSNITIVRNNMTSNNQGMVISEGIDNFAFENSVINNNVGVLLFSTSNSKLYHNNFISNSLQTIFIGLVHANYWDNGIEGNYWSDYDETDLDGDGIGDTPYVIDTNNTDNYPLMGMFRSFNTSQGYTVDVISNSTIDDFEYFESNSTIRMYVSNMTLNQAFGFCRMCIPHDLVFEPFNVTINGANPIYWNYTLFDNGTHRWIYFSYEHSTVEIVIVPEFPLMLILPLLMITSIIVALMKKSKAYQKRT